MRHFIDLTDWSASELDELLTLARNLKSEWRAGGNRPLLAGKALAMVFQKASLRTRVSFEVGMLHLGGHAIYISPQEIGLGVRESIPDIARVLSGYVQGIMARVYDHDHMRQLAASSSVPVINGLSDWMHPCQTLADLLTIYEHFGRLNGVKVAYVGDCNNVTRSLAIAAARFDMALTVASPVEYGPDEDFLRTTHEAGLELGLTTDPVEAVRGADVVYTDTWVSMGQEAEAETRHRILRPYQINANLMKSAPKDAIVMHCLPAHRGLEITDEVADSLAGDDLPAGGKSAARAKGHIGQTDGVSSGFPVVLSRKE
jgi:ornithine carbamoyltransferase